MAKALDSELRELGIPFFAIKYSLVCPQSRLQAEGNTVSLRIEETDQNHSISTEELAKFQQRMLDLLEDLCKE